MVSGVDALGHWAFKTLVRGIGIMFLFRSMAEIADMLIHLGIVDPDLTCYTVLHYAEIPK